MSSNEWKKSKLKALTRKLVRSYATLRGINQIDVLNLPNASNIVEIIQDFQRVIFPGYFGSEAISSTGVDYYVGNLLERLYDSLHAQIHRALEYQCPSKSDRACKICDCVDRAQTLTVQVLEAIPRVRELLKEDVQAAFDGDPAAHSLDEIIVSYPYIKAITVHRFAHLLYERDVPLIPRIMNEWAHRETGIDIHPGAKIGHAFFIDHGTGVVIGETTEIGDHVKLYHGVTLGAKSTFDVTELRGKKRHPTLEGRVTIYPNATILGGDTVIGKGATVGGNTWIMENVKPGTTVTIAKPELVIREKRKGR